MTIDNRLVMSYYAFSRDALTKDYITRINSNSISPNQMIVSHTHYDIIGTLIRCSN